MQHAVDAKTNDTAVSPGLDVNIGRALFEGVLP